MFYQPVVSIGDLLEMDLADGTTVTALHAALYGLQSTGDLAGPTVSPR